MDTEGYRHVTVVARNGYGGIASATVPVAALPSTADTLQLGGGYETGSAGTHFDCRISRGSFSGRNAWTNGADRSAETEWAVYAF